MINTVMANTTNRRRGSICIRHYGQFPVNIAGTGQRTVANDGNLMTYVRYRLYHVK